MVSQKRILPEVADYVYSSSMAMHGQPANVGPRVGIVCSDMFFLMNQYGSEYTSEFFRLHGKNIGGIIVSESGFPKSADVTKKIRYVGKFDDELMCTLAFQGVARAILGSTRFRLYYGTAVRLMSEEEHVAFLDGYARGLAWLEDVEDYNRTITTTAMLYHHVPFWDDVCSLTDILLEKGVRAKSQDLLVRIVERAKEYTEKVR